MKTKLYLDTSVPSAYYDYSKPLRQLITQKWFENESQNFEIYISVICLEEINELKNDIKRKNINKLLLDYDMIALPFTNEAETLGNEYISKGAIPATEPEDAFHIAIATINKIESIASWNFKHIVSANPIRKIHEINFKNNYSLIEIGSLELFGGAKYGNL